MARNSTLFLLGLVSLSVMINAASAANAYNHFVGDFNGDRIYDFVRQKKGDWAGQSSEIFLSNGRGTFKKSTLTSSLDLNGDLTNLYVGDFNGDGRDDLLRQEKGSWASDNVNMAYLLLSTGSDFSKTVLPDNLDLNGELTNLYIGDFNGDGKDDVLRQEKGAWATDNVNMAYLLLSTGSGFRKIVLPSDLDLNGDLTNLYVGDFNGDGKDDVLRQEKGSWASDNVNMAYLLISTGEGFSKIVLPDNLDLNGELTTLHIGDFNGDGKSDVLRREKGSWASDNVNSAYLLISEGRSFSKTVLNEDFAIKATNTNLYLGDFNGDGKTDFIRQEKGDISKDNSRTAEVFLSTGNNFKIVPFPEDQEMKGDTSTLYVGDFNGDKTSDFIQNWNLDVYFAHYAQGDGYFF